ncbi:MAG TPA: VWD domain-containing protein [Ilumatobacter sp.]|nr:VWD domain-containing protein [Ilumatobacter sp.]
MLFTADDDPAVTVELLHLTADGEPTGVKLPAGTELVRIGDTFEIDLDTSAGSITVAGAETIDAELVGVRIPGQAGLLTLWVTSLRTAPDVVLVDPTQVAFPKPELADRDDLTATDVAEYIAPFTIDELAARLVESEAGGDDQPAGVTHVPYVLEGSAPEHGTVLAGLGAYGRVTATDSVPTIERGDRTLVMLELLPLPEVYTDVVVSLDYEEIYQAGLLGWEPPGLVCFGGDPDEPCEPITDAPAGPAAAGFARPRTASSAPPPSKVTKNGPCEADAKARLGNVKIVTEFTVRPTGGLYISQRSDETIRTMTFSGGLRGGAKFGVQGEAQVSGELSLNCKLGELGEVSTPVPGPLAAFLDGVTNFPITLELGGRFSAGPFFSLTAVCGIDVHLEGGIQIDFDHTSAWPVNLSQSPTIGCPDSGITTNNWGFPFDIELSLGLFASANSGLRFGGTVTKVLGVLFANQDLGEFTPVVVKIGPQIVVTYENDAHVVAQQRHSSGIVSQFTVSGGLDVSGVYSLFQMVGLNISPPDLVIEASRPVGRLIGPPGEASTPMNVHIDDVAHTDAGPIPVDIGSTAVISTVFAEAEPAVFPLAVGRPITTYETTGVEFTPVDEFEWLVIGSSIGAYFEMTEERCAEFQTPRSFAVVASTDMPSIHLPLYAGEFEVVCGENLRFALPGDPGYGTLALAIELNRGNPVERVVLKQRGHDDKNWQLGGSGGGGFVSVSPIQGVFHSDEVLIDVTLDCGDDYDATGQAWYGAGILLHPLSDARLDIDYDCRVDWIEVEPAMVTAGRTVTLRSDGQYDDQWVATGAPAGMLTTTSGLLAADETAIYPLEVRDPRPAPECGQVLPAQTVMIVFTTTTRESATLEVTLPERDGPRNPGEDSPDPCDDDGGGGVAPEDDEEEQQPDEPDGPTGGPAGGQGDPHMRSFNGLRYEAQTLGEYVYAESDDGHVRIVARHELSDPDGTAILVSANATSITALSVEVGEHQVEAYPVHGPAGPGIELIVDGELRPLGDHRSIHAGGGLSVSRQSSTQVLIRGPEFKIDVRWGSVPSLNVFGYFAYHQVATLNGFLGSNDYDADNDLMMREGLAFAHDDPERELYMISLAQARQHGESFRYFTDSWRLRDLSDSPFTRPSDVFHEPNPGRPTNAELEPFRQQARDLMGSLTALCSGAEASTYIIDLMAIELAIDTELSELANYLCGFEAIGRVTVDTGRAVLGVHGAVVEVTAPGLTPCTTVAEANGSYRCRMLPDADLFETSGDVEFPLVFDVAVSAPGGTSTVGATTGTFANRPGYGATTGSLGNDVELDVADLVVVELSGSLSSHGLPHRAATSFELVYDDHTGGSRTRAITPAPDGTYAAAFVVPLDVDDVEVIWHQGLDGDPRPAQLLADDGFQLGINERTFDATYHPPIVEAAGIARVNGTVPDEVLVRLIAQLPDGNSVERRIVVQPDPFTGVFAGQRVLPLATISVDVIVEAHHTTAGPVTRATVLGEPLPGVVSVPIDLVVDTPTLLVSGVARLHGELVDGPVDFTVRATIEGADEPWTVTFAQQPVVTGEYGFAAVLPDGAVDSTITAHVGEVPANWPVHTEPALTGGPRSVEFSFDATYPYLAIGGTITGGTVGYTEPVTFEVAVDEPEPFTVTRLVEPDAHGNYDLLVDLPLGATHAQVTAQVGFDSGDWVTIVAGAGDPLGAGRNEVAFDPAFAAVALLLDGQLEVRGAAVDGDVELDVSTFDVSGQPLDGHRVIVAADDGAYQRRVFLPTDVAAAAIAMRPDDTASGRVWQRFEGLTPGPHPAAYSHHYNPPVIDLHGAFTFGGTPLADPFSLYTHLTFVSDAGTVVTGSRLSTISVAADGSYQTTVELPETTSEVTFTAWVGPTPASYPTVTLTRTSDVALVDGPQPLAFSADLVIPVDVAMNAIFLAGADPLASRLVRVRYRAYDWRGVRIVDETDLALTLNVAGAVELTRQLPPQVRRFEVAWLDSHAPTFQRFDVQPGPNDLDDVEFVSEWVDLVVSGRLTDAGQPFTEPTELTFVPLGIDDASMGLLMPVRRVVEPDANGNYLTDVRFPPGTFTVRVRWADSHYPLTETTYQVSPGTNIIAHSDDVGTPGAQRVLVSGTVTIGDQGWPEPVEFRVARRWLDVSGTQTITRTVTPDPLTGAYQFEYDESADPTVTFYPLVSVTITARVGDQPELTVPVVRDGDTVVTDFDVAVPGKLLTVTGSVASDGAAPDWLPVHIIDANDPATSGWAWATPAGDASFTASALLNWPADAVYLATEIDFPDDLVVAPGPHTMNGSIVEIDDVVFDLAGAPTLEVTGTLTRDGAPLTEPVWVDITWFDDDGPSPMFDTWDLRSEWTTSAEVTPDETGRYALPGMSGPLRADRALVEIAMFGPLGQRSTVVAELQPGVNQVELDVSDETTDVVIDGTLVVADEPRGGTYDVAISAYDGDELVAELWAEVSPDADDGGAFTLAVGLPAGTDRAVFELRLDWSANPIVHELTGILPDGSTSRWDAHVSRLDLAGTVEARGGDPRGVEFDYVLRAYAGGAEGELLATIADSRFSSFGSGEIPAFHHYLPATADTVVIEMHGLAGVVPITLTGLTSGANSREIEIVTDPMQTLTIEGRLSVDGAHPALAGPTPSVYVSYYRLDTDSDGGYRRQEFNAPTVHIDYSGPAGDMATTLLVPPEVDLVDVYVSFRGDDPAAYERSFDLRGATAPYAVDLTIDHRPSRVAYVGLAEVDSTQTCARAGQPFLFEMTVWGYLGNPAGPGTPPPVKLFEGFVVPNEQSWPDGSTSINWERNVPVPDGVTHVQAQYRATEAGNPGQVAFDVTRPPAAFSGGVLELFEHLVAACVP